MCMVLPVLVIMLLPLLLVHQYNPTLVTEVTHTLLDLVIPRILIICFLLKMKEDFKSAIYEEGYDLFDPKYASSIEINHHENSYRSTELHTDTSVPSIAEMYSRIPPSEHVASVNLFPTSSINGSTITAIFVFCQMK